MSRMDSSGISSMDSQDFWNITFVSIGYSLQSFKEKINRQDESLFNQKNNEIKDTIQKINDKELEPHKFYELKNLDLLRLGDCTLEVRIKQGLFG